MERHMKLMDRKLGIIGLGQMGGGIAANIARAGYDITGYDLNPDAIARFIDAGGKQAGSGEEIVAQCDIVLTCVEGKDAITIADTILLPNARLGQTFIDHSTLPVPQTRRIGQAYIDKGCRFLDAPISGGVGGAAEGILRIFVGGDKTTADEMWPLFEVAGNPEKIVYCGKIGTGQSTKVVQQLTTRFPDVARLEVLAFGLRSGVDLDTVIRGLDETPGGGGPYDTLCTAIRDGSYTEAMSGLFSEWEYYLEEARDSGFRMPMMEAMFEFCKDADTPHLDPLKRPVPSIWQELMDYTKEPV